MEAKTIVCISCYYKGAHFIDEMHKLGNRIILITSENLKEKPWPREAINEVFYMVETAPNKWNLDHLILGFAHLLKSTAVDAVIALDDYDVEKAALIRETFRIPGMGQTTHRYFRDKLAMRQQAQDSGINAPEFTSIFNDAAVHRFTEKIPSPWVLKPRSEASASGIQKVRNSDELWESIDNLGEERHLFLLERFKSGAVYHVDSIIYKGKIVFETYSKYLETPMEVSHEGGVFRTRTIAQNVKEARELKKISKAVLSHFGMVNGVSHSEYIQGEKGHFYFLETASRVGGAHIPDMIEAATGVDIWREWARLENAVLRGQSYTVKPSQQDYAGLIISLIKEEKAHTADFKCKEIDRFLPLPHHIGIVYKAREEEKIIARMWEATQLITEKYLNVLPPTDHPTS